MKYQIANFGPTLQNKGYVVRLLDGAIIPPDPANTDYANFKAQINADEAQLEDAEGTLMTAEQAKAYVATLP